MVGQAGEIKPGDAVKTLNRTRAIYGRVLDETPKKSRRLGYWIVEGRTQPGAKAERFTVHKENLDRIPEEELAPEDRQC